MATASTNPATATAPVTAPVAARATLRYHRSSAQKARLVVDQIRGKGVNEALGLLQHSPKAASRAIEKLLRSAAANAAQGAEKVDADRLYVYEAQVGPGPSLKRFRGRAFGRAFRILHRSCHISLTLRARPVRVRVASKGTPHESGRKEAPAAPAKS
ncbi:MAG TPA: 50S ribosomal protein L22 [Candidatus Polarisedimenticolia bacterium]|nr:50S ribosomal protein L22 [Candidatus Polarisedimenticolia bacterium]